MPSGEKQQEESCPHLRQGELLLRAPLTSGLGFPRAGPGDDAGLRSRRCTAPREGRAPGRGEKVDLSLEGILLTIFFPFPGDAAAPQVPSLAVRGQSRRQRHNIPRTGRDSRTRPPRGRLRPKEGVGKDTRG